MTNKPCPRCDQRVEPVKYIPELVPAGTHPPPAVDNSLIVCGFCRLPLSMWPDWRLMRERIHELKGPEPFADDRGREEVNAMNQFSGSMLDSHRAWRWTRVTETQQSPPLVIVCDLCDGEGCDACQPDKETRAQLEQLQARVEQLEQQQHAEDAPDLVADAAAAFEKRLEQLEYVAETSKGLEFTLMGDRVRAIGRTIEQLQAWSDSFVAVSNENLQEVDGRLRALEQQLNR